MFGINLKIIGFVVAILFCISISYGLMEMVWKPKLKLERERVAFLSATLEGNSSIFESEKIKFKNSITSCEKRIKNKNMDCNTYIQILTEGETNDNTSLTDDVILNELNSMWD